MEPRKFALVAFRVLSIYLFVTFLPSEIHILSISTGEQLLNGPLGIFGVVIAVLICLGIPIIIWLTASGLSVRAIQCPDDTQNSNEPIGTTDVLRIAIVIIGLFLFTQGIVKFIGDGITILAGLRGFGWILASPMVSILLGLFMILKVVRIEACLSKSLEKGVE